MVVWTVVSGNTKSLNYVCNNGICDHSQPMKSTPVTNATKVSKMLPDLPSLWKSTWYHSPSFTFLFTASVLVVPDPISRSRYKRPSSISMAKKSTFRVKGLLASFVFCLGFPWLKRRSPLGSVVRKSKEIEPVFLVSHLGSVMKDSGVSKVMGSNVATFSHLKETTPWIFIFGSPVKASLESSSRTSLFLYATYKYKTMSIEQK